MRTVLPAYLRMLQNNKKNPGFLDERWFDRKESKALGVHIRMIKPVLTFPDGKVRPGYNVGTRGNGVDAPKWPDDLLTEIVS
jgi:hypothetical protein